MQRSGRPTEILGGYKLDGNLLPKRELINTMAPGDYGADPVEGGMFRMVPSGDIVDGAERDRRLSAARGAGLR